MRKNSGDSIFANQPAPLRSESQESTSFRLLLTLPVLELERVVVVVVLELLLLNWRVWLGPVPWSWEALL